MKRHTLGSSLFRHALLAMALVTLAIAAPVTLDAGPQGPPENRGDRGGAPDPCTQAAETPGKSKGLERRCEHGPSSGGAARGDFNGDGYADLAIGTPYEDVGTTRDAGTVNIIYGTATGLTATTIPDQAFNVDALISPAGFPSGSVDPNDLFGFALASGLFNDDDYSDLAIGAPGITSDGGAVYVVYGSEDGLQLNSADVIDVGGQSGASLVWGDFNDDGIGDLAVGAPLATVWGDGFFCSLARFQVKEAGEVRVYYGSPDGLTEFGRQIFRQGGCTYSDGIGVGDSPEEDDHFGFALAAGGFHDSTAAADLVIGVPYEDLALFDKREAGLLHIIPGFSSMGLDPRFVQTLTQDTSGAADVSETGDYFGNVLATGDFDGDGRDDLAVGLPWEDIGTSVDAGAVHVFFGGTTFNELVTTDGDLFIDQGDLAGVAIENGDRMGWALAAGRFDGDTRDDLAVGVPREDVSSNTISNAGIVIVLYGSSAGPSLTDIQIWSQNGTGTDLAEPGDEFGRSLSAWNFGNSSHADLAIGAPFEDVPGGTGALQVDAGAVSVIYGSTSGLTATGSQFWHQDSVGVNGTAEAGDRFGNALY